MKRVIGQDLRQILLDLKHEVPSAVEKFPLPRLLDILIRVSQTIAYAHSVGVVHRDLKPANIIVGKFGEVYVLDWGLAKVLGEKSLAQELGTQRSTRPWPNSQRNALWNPHVYDSRNYPWIK